MISLELANDSALAWAQAQASAHHYLHAPVDSRCSVLGYVVNRPLRGLQGAERKLIERFCAQSYRSRVYRSQRAVHAVQEVLL